MLELLFKEMWPCGGGGGAQVRDFIDSGRLMMGEGMKEDPMMDEGKLETGCRERRRRGARWPRERAAAAASRVVTLQICDCRALISPSAAAGPALLHHNREIKKQPPQQHNAAPPTPDGGGNCPPPEGESLPGTGIRIFQPVASVLQHKL